MKISNSIEKSSKIRKLNDDNVEKIGHNFFNYFVDDLLKELLSFFSNDIHTLGNLRVTCRDFHRIIQKYFWETIVPIQYLPSLFVFPNLGPLCSSISIKVPNIESWLDYEKHLKLLKNTNLHTIRIIGDCKFNNFTDYLPFGSLKLLFLSYSCDLFDYLKKFRCNFMNHMARDAIYLFNLNGKDQYYDWYTFYTFFIVYDAGYEFGLLNDETSDPMYLIKNRFESVENAITINFKSSINGCTPILNFFHNRESNNGDFDEEKFYNFLLQCYIKFGKVNLNITDNLGMTSLHLACEKILFLDIVTLVKNGAKINEKNFDGCTPLWLFLDNIRKSNLKKLSSSRALYMFKFMLKNGADIHIENKNGITPLHLALLTNTKLISSIDPFELTKPKSINLFQYFENNKKQIKGHNNFVDISKYLLNIKL